MAITPEGKIKTRVKLLLCSYTGCYYGMPVQGGYGAVMLDFYGCFRGRFFAIETKAKGKKPTARQQKLMDEIREAGGAVFLIDGNEGITELKSWMEWVLAASV